MAIELGWEFVTLVSVSSMAFSGFSKYMTSQYLRNNPKSRSFMDTKTFIKSWFGWACCMHIDFRQPCKWCGWDPPILAGDGTHAGLPKSKSSIDPIQKRQDTPPIETPHRRMDMCFLREKHHRDHFRYLTGRYLHRGTPALPPDQEQTRTADLCDALPDSCQAAFLFFIQQGGTHSQLCTLDHVLRLVSYDSSLSAFHGHCYGAHVVDGGEGRKDPAFSVYTHKQTAPSVLFYDFGCALDEYNLNRESGFFMNTKVNHDLFHSYNHVCSSVFKSSRIASLQHCNTSICKQFNSYLQKIKASARNMSQEHLMFYLQFFIHIWNMNKKDTVERRLQHAVHATV